LLNKDRLETKNVKSIDPARFALAVTPDDNNLLEYTSRSLYIGNEGDIEVMMSGMNNTIIFKNVPVGILPIQVNQVMASGTTASNIISLW